MSLYIIVMERFHFLRRRHAFVVGVLLFVFTLYIVQFPKAVEHNDSFRVAGVSVAPKPFVLDQERIPHLLQGPDGDGNFTLWARMTVTNTIPGDERDRYRLEDAEHTEQKGGTNNDFRRKNEMSNGSDKNLYTEDDDSFETNFNFHTEAKTVDKEKMVPPISSFLPKSGNTLPNFLTKGISLGLRPKHYQEGIIAFLHHNKAAGSSIKSCLLSMTKRGIIKDHNSSLIMSSKKISLIKRKYLHKYTVFVGGYTFWLCEQFDGRNCSYFTIMRNPYDRILSSYFYCKAQPWDQLCGPLETGNFTIQEWAIYQGSYFFNQLLMNRGYCRQNDDIRRLFDRGIDDLIPPNTGHYISFEETYQCWFRQKVFLNRSLNETGRMHLLQNVLDNLESWFAVIGTTEDFDLSLKMLSFTYELPFLRRCRGKKINKGHYSGSGETEKENIKEKLKAALKSDVTVVEALKYDMRIYERGLQIFERQKEELERIIAKKNQNRK